MSYDLYFMREHRGKSPMEYFDDLQAGTAEIDEASAINIHEVSDSLLELGIGLKLHAHRVEAEGEPGVDRTDGTAANPRTDADSNRSAERDFDDPLLGADVGLDC